MITKPNQYVLKIAGQAFTQAVKNQETVQQAVGAAIEVAHKLLLQENASLAQQVEGLERNNQILMRSICPAGKCKLNQEGK